MLDKIKSIIQTAIPDATVYVSDPHQDGQHFEGIVISGSFVGMPLIRQHQKVLNALKEAMHTDVHAIALKTYTPEKWKNEKHGGQ